MTILWAQVLSSSRSCVFFLEVRRLKSTGLLIGLPNFDMNWQIYSDAPRYTEVGGVGGGAIKVESV